MILLLMYLVLVSFLDLKYRSIPLGVSALGASLGILCNVFNGSITYSFLGMGLGIILTHSLNHIRKAKLGGGDAKTLAVIGSFLGPLGVAIVLPLSMLISYLVKPFIRSNYVNGSIKIAYIPFMAMSTLLVVIWIKILF